MWRRLAQGIVVVVVVVVVVVIVVAEENCYVETLCTRYHDCLYVILLELQKVFLLSKTIGSV